ncbi:putative oxidoreductase YciK [Burkholderiales bacterium]|nr:putative oxidoreductase YciK [Burkholderiales bacterium]
MTPANHPLADRIVLVTGAGQGLGKAVAVAAAAAGARVILHGRSLKKLERVYDAIAAAGRTAPLLFPLDLNQADDPSFAAMAHAIDTQFGRLDGLVHCAVALEGLAPFSQITLAQWNEVLRVNLGASAALTRACLGLLKASGHGRVIFTLADRGEEPKAYWGAYAASKAGLAALVKLLRDEWENEPALGVAGVIPGPVFSPSRIRTHPGASLMDLSAVEALAPLYLELLAGSMHRDEPIIAAQNWLRQRLAPQPPHADAASGCAACETPPRPPHRA